jgi:hypothetical protein
MAVLNPEARLRAMVQADADPELSNDEVETLLYDHRIVSVYSEWLPSTVYALGAKAVPRLGNNHVYVVTVAGTSGTSEPPFPDAPFSTVTDGTVTWQETLSITSHYMNRAIAAGWMLKAAKVANRYDVDVDRFQRLKRDQLIKHCLEMAKQYNGKSIQSILVTGAGGYDLPVIGNLNNG